MQNIPLGIVFVILSIGLGTSAAWPSQSTSVSSHTQPQADPPVNAADNDKPAIKSLPSIVDEEEIPAFLRTDPCDTGDL